MAIMYSAWFSLRSPARDSRWRTPWPLEASNGAVPVWASKVVLAGEPADVTDLTQERGRKHRPHAEQLDQAGVGLSNRHLDARLDGGDGWSSWRTSATRSVASCQRVTAGAPAGVTAASSPAARLAVRLRRAPPGTRVHQRRWSRLMVWVRAATKSWRRLVNRCSPRGSDPAPWLGRCRARGSHSFRQCSESGGGKCLVWC
jgi:hypothetical protein